MSNVVIDRRLLEGWADSSPLTGADWYKFAESLPASEFATALLAVADAMDQRIIRAAAVNIDSIRSWLKANDIPANKVPVDQEIHIDGCWIRLELFTLQENGLKKLDSAGNTIRESFSFPLISAPEAHRL